MQFPQCTPDYLGREFSKYHSYSNYRCIKPVAIPLHYEMDRKSFVSSNIDPNGYKNPTIFIPLLAELNITCENNGAGSSWFRNLWCAKIPHTCIVRWKTILNNWTRTDWMSLDRHGNQPTGLFTSVVWVTVASLLCEYMWACLWVRFIVSHGRVFVCGTAPANLAGEVAH